MIASKYEHHPNQIITWEKESSSVEKKIKKANISIHHPESVFWAPDDMVLAFINCMTSFL